MTTTETTTETTGLDPTTPERSPTAAAPPWRRALAEAVTDPAELLRLLELPEGLLEPARRAARQFPVRVPLGYLARMRPGDPDDPLLRQVLPLGVELEERPGYGPDPVGEQGQPGEQGQQGELGQLGEPTGGEGNGEGAAGAVRGAGVLQKYHGRALLVVTGACAVHCRYCFRRHFPYGDHQPGWSGWGEALEPLAADETLDEVILSGGDPLAVSDDRLAELARRLEAIPHLRRLRVHSRTPVVLPERVDDHLLAWLAGGRLEPVLVIHANHPREIDASVAAALGRLREAGVTLLNQSVLLAGVNDRADTLVELSEALFGAGALPYYLHALDPVAGAAHFEVSDGRARELVGEMTARLSGYLVPKLVREVPGAPSKVGL